MEPLAEFLEQTLDDGRLSRGEASALRQALADLEPRHRSATSLRPAAFDVARRALLAGRPSGEIVDWLEAVSRLLELAVEPAVERGAESSRSEATFTPGEGCLRRILTHLTGARKSADICVFTITDDRIAEAISSAAARRVAVRVITDDAKSADLGSDIGRFVGAGIPVAIDRDGHMHHKFAIVDGARLLTGSYNWTRGAAELNHENIVVTADERLVGAFGEEFERLWKRFERA